ncbi:MAG TPA: DUF4328 domain-containing protein [Kutzneria sp.]
MESNHGAPLGAPMPADYRRGYRQWQPVNGLAVAASVMVGLVALLSVLEAIADVTGQDRQELLFLMLYVVGRLAAAVVFIVWLWRVRANAELVAGAQSQRLGRGWAIGCWFCPVVNLWFPYRYVVDVWRASRPARGADGLVLAWWLTWLAGNLIGTFGANDPGHTVTIVSSALEVAAAVPAVLIIRKISEWQSVLRA